MPTTNKALEQPAYNSPSWDVPVNQNSGYIDQALGSWTTISVTGIGTSPVTLTSAQYIPMGIKFTGTLSNTVTYRLPSGVGGRWTIQNSTSGAFSVLFTSAGGGTSVTLPQGFSRTVVSDGTNITFADTNSTVPGSSGQVLFNSSGALGADAELTYDATGNILSTSLLSLQAGTVTAPSLFPAGDANTGIYFPGADNIGFSTSGTLRMQIGPVGQFGIGSSYGTSGQMIMSSGSGAAPVWAKPMELVVGNVTAPASNTWTISSLDLTPYRAIRIVFRAMSHTAGADREFLFDGITITSLVGAGATVVGVINVEFMEGTGSVMAFNTGNNGGFGPTGGAAGCSYTSASTSVTFTLSGSGNFDGGVAYIYGIR